MSKRYLSKTRECTYFREILYLRIWSVGTLTLDWVYNAKYIEFLLYALLFAFLVCSFNLVLFQQIYTQCSIRRRFVENIARVLYFNKTYVILTPLLLFWIYINSVRLPIRLPWGVTFTAIKFYIILIIIV